VSNPDPRLTAMGYRSFAAPRLCLMPLKTANFFRGFFSLSLDAFALNLSEKQVSDKLKFVGHLRE